MTALVTACCGRVSGKIRYSALVRVISGHKEIGVRTKNEKYILKLNCARHNYVIVDLLDFWEGFISNPSLRLNIYGS